MLHAAAVGGQQRKIRSRALHIAQENTEQITDQFVIIYAMDASAGVCVGSITAATTA